MKIRPSRSGERKSGAESLTTMIDVVFLLLIFFLLTLRILAPEGEFSLTMPQEARAAAINSPPPPTEIRIRLLANEDGTLKELLLGRRNLGNDRRAFQRLNHELFRLVGPAAPLSDNLQIEIESDYHLNYEHVLAAVAACTARVDEETGRTIPYNGKIKFAPPRRPG